MTTTYVAFLRGINVGGRNKLPMKALVELMEGIDLKQVKTYIQSGNVVFRADLESPAELAARCARAIAAEHGFKPQILILKLTDLEDAMAANPFPKAEDHPRTLHLGLLAERPQEPDLETLDQIKKPSERFELKETIFYLHAPDGIGRSKLAARAEALIGVSMTSRNWRTLSETLALARRVDQT